MRNRIIIFLIFFLYSVSAYTDNLKIQALNITIDKNSKTTVLKNQVIAEDDQNNKLTTEHAVYNKELQKIETIGETTLITSKGYSVKGKNIVFDKKNNFIKSKEPALIKDLENNLIYLNNFEYLISDGLFKSLGEIEIHDSKDNKYYFSQVYIDENKREIVGTDAKTFLNEDDFKTDKLNKPRIFSNTVSIYDEGAKFTKSIFTICNYRPKDKCPPWTIQAKEMLHDKKKKTIYYDNAVIKVYDLPIFFLPKLSHPDPSVDRRSGFLPPSFSDSKNLGTGFEIPYFWALNKDKDFTFRNKLFTSENPLFLGEYRQAFYQSDLIFDFGYTKGYKKTSDKKKPGDKSHFFTKFVKNFKGSNNSSNNLELTLQNVSNDKYLKLYKIKSNLVEYEKDTLENSLTFTREDDKSFLGFKASAYETLKDTYNDKYEYILPDIIYDKNLFASNKYGVLDFTSNFNVHNYDTNKFTRFLINDFDWKFRTNIFSSGFRGNWMGKIKNVNYEAKNTEEFKQDPETEVFGAIGYLADIDLFKKHNEKSQFLTPKIFLRYAPGTMRKNDDDIRINAKNIFSLDRLNSGNNFESGLSATLGFDYAIEQNNKNYKFSIGQIINEKENSNMPTKSSLDEKLSDLVGNADIQINDSFNLNYNFSLDQNYKDLNYNEIGFNYDLNPIKFDINYLQEKKHIGNQEYLKTNLQYTKGNNGLLSFNMKRNIITNSAEYYNLSYEYLNDCLRAGIVYRREFYNDSELEAENSLMFKITLTPLGDIRSPSFNE